MICGIEELYIIYFHMKMPVEQQREIRSMRPSQHLHDLQLSSINRDLLKKQKSHFSLLRSLLPLSNEPEEIMKKKETEGSFDHIINKFVTKRYTQNIPNNEINNPPLSQSVKIDSFDCQRLKEISTNRQANTERLSHKVSNLKGIVLPEISTLKKSVTLEPKQQFDEDYEKYEKIVKDSMKLSLIQEQQGIKRRRPLGAPRVNKLTHQQSLVQINK